MTEFKEEFVEALNMGDNILQLGQGKHVAILGKPNGNPEDFGSCILETIVRLMTAAYPDYVHWAALEIAGGIKRFAPQWLESLPRGMDWALLSEYCHGKEDTAELIVENLLEDLAHFIPPHELKSTRPENCKGGDWSGLNELLSKSDGIEDGDELSLLRLDQPPPDIRRGLPTLLEKAEHKLILEFLKVQSEFTSFCENVSGGGVNNAAILPGSIFKKQTATGGARQIFVCVSQGCDCIRGNKLLFIRGTKEKKAKLGSTLVEFKRTRYRFDAESKNLIVIEIEDIDGKRVPQNLEKIGQFRAAIARRLSSRFWNYATRSAVNHSAFTRSERGGE